MRGGGGGIVQAIAGEHLEQLRLGEWLAQKGQGAEVEDAVMCLLLDVAGDHNHHGLQLLSADRLQHLITIQPGHIQIEEQQVTQPLAQQGQRLLTMAGDGQVMRQTGGQRADQLLAGKARVIADDNRGQHARVQPVVKRKTEAALSHALMTKQGGERTRFAHDSCGYSPCLASQLQTVQCLAQDSNAAFNLIRCLGVIQACTPADGASAGHECRGRSSGRRSDRVP